MLNRGQGVALSVDSKSTLGQESVTCLGPRSTATWRMLRNPNGQPFREVRQMIREEVPEAEEGISYGLPAFRLKGKVVAGFAGLQEPSQLPPSQRLRVSSASGRSRPLQDIEWGASVSNRLTVAEASCGAPGPRANLPSISRGPGRVRSLDRGTVISAADPVVGGRWHGSRRSVPICEEDQAATIRLPDLSMERKL